MTLKFRPATPLDLLELVALRARILIVEDQGRSDHRVITSANVKVYDAWLEGERARVEAFEDMFTDDAYRRRGIFKRRIGIISETGSDLMFIYGRPHDLSRPGHH